MQDTKYNFMGKYKKSFMCFGLLCVIAIISLAVRGLSQSIDFTGGRNYKVEFINPVQTEDVKAAIVKQFEANNPEGEAINVTVIALGTDGTNVRVSTNYLIKENNAESDALIESMLYKAFVDGGMVDASVSEADFLDRDNRAGGSIVSSQKVGPSIAEDITYGAILSVLFAIVVIFVYILVRFRNVAYSVGSILALVVDTLLVIGAFSLCYGWMPFSLEIDQTFIGAILTVIGYSINDKVVVFDRIRETFQRHPRRDRQQNFNDSLNACLARTVNTSVSTLVVLLVIFFLGGDSIRPFSFAMILGVTIGTFSSLFVAAPTAYLVMGARIKEDEAAPTETA
jgi:SecD/SecF fusion protein